MGYHRLCGILASFCKLRLRLLNPNQILVTPPSENVRKPQWLVSPLLSTSNTGLSMCMKSMCFYAFLISIMCISCCWSYNPFNYILTTILIVRYTNIYIYIYMYSIYYKAYIYMYIHVNLYIVCICIYIYNHIYVCVHVSICIYIYAHTQREIYIYIYTYDIHIKLI